MAKMKVRKERLSIYLVKNGIDDHQLLKLENTKPVIFLEVEGFEESRLYVKKEPPLHSPSWSKVFLEHGDCPEDVFGESSSVGAVYVVGFGGDQFVLSFGTGYHLIDMDNIERDFGLRVTLNSVAPDKLRSLDKSSYDHNPLNSRTQSSREVDIFDLQINSELEILQTVTGVSAVPLFGSNVTGRDSLTLVVETDLKGIPDILREALNRYSQKLPSQFEWVDNICRVKDLLEAEILDIELDAVLKSGNYSGMYLGEPEIVDWENHVGYSFDLNAKSPRHVTLTLQAFIDYLAAKGASLSVSALKAVDVSVNDSDYRPVKSWSVYRCLYFEMVYLGDRYILRNGIWYKVDLDFEKSINTYLGGVNLLDYDLPLYSYDKEDEYNSSLVAADADYALMDKKLLKVGGPYDKLEFCDLVKGGCDLIHVKYYRSSTSLSHLFAQGCVSAETFVRDQDFRVKVNSKLPLSIQLVDPSGRPDPSSYRIVYAIATNKKLPEDLPFFSKVTLKNAVRNLRALDYGVALAKIDVDASLYVKKKYK